MHNYRINFLEGILLGFIWLICSFGATGEAKVIGYAGVILHFLFLVLVTITIVENRKKIPGGLIHSFKLFLPILIIYFISILIVARGLDEFIRLFQLLLICLIFSYYSFSQRDGAIVSLALCIALMVLSFFILFLATGMNIPFKGIFNSQNTTAPILLSYIYFLIIALWSVRGSLLKLIFGFSIVIALFLFAKTEVRSAYLSIIAGLILWSLWPWITKRKILFWVTIYSGYLMIIGVMVVLAIISSFNISDYGQLAIKYTGADLTTGREKIWLPVFEKVLEKPFLGYGLGINARQLIGAEVNSAHNLYLQTAMQSGFLGLLSIIGIFHMIWSRLLSLKDNKSARLTAAFFVGILVHQTFEVALFSNQIYLGIIFWHILAMGYNAKNEVSDFNRMEVK